MIKEQMDAALALWMQGRIGRIIVSRELIAQVPTAMGAIGQEFVSLKSCYNSDADSFLMDGLSRFFDPRPGEPIATYIFEFNSVGFIKSANRQEG